MIDFTTIQHFKIPPSIGELQKTNKRYALPVLSL